MNTDLNYEPHKKGAVLHYGLIVGEDHVSGEGGHLKTGVSAADVKLVRQVASTDPLRNDATRVFYDMVMLDNHIRRLTVAQAILQEAERRHDTHLQNVQNAINQANESLEEASAVRQTAVHDVLAVLNNPTPVVDEQDALKDFTKVRTTSKIPKLRTPASPALSEQQIALRAFVDTSLEQKIQERAAVQQEVATLAPETAEPLYEEAIGILLTRVLALDPHSIESAAYGADLCRYSETQRAIRLGLGALAYDGTAEAVFGEVENS